MSFKDLFAYGKLFPQPAINEQRPMDPVSLKRITSSVNQPSARPSKTVLGGAISHVVHNYWSLNDMFDDEGFNLATDHLFRQIREEYKSILPYTLSDFKRLLLAVTNVYTAVAQVKACLAWYNMVDPSVPELHESLIHVTSNRSERGFVEKEALSFLSEENLSKSLNEISYIELELSTLPFPAKFKQFIDWLIGNLFVDSSYPNKQYYVNIFTDFPLYGIDSQFNLVEVGEFRIDAIDVDALKQSITTLKQFGAIMNADIFKVKNLSYAVPNLNFGVKDKDYDYFNILINRYNPANQSLMDNYMFNKEYVRADVLGEVSDDHLLAAMFGLAEWAGYKPCIKLSTQAMYLAIPDGYKIQPRITGRFTATTDINTTVVGRSMFYVLPDNNADFSVETNATTGTSSTVYHFNSDHRATAVAGTLTGGKITPVGMWMRSYGAPRLFTPGTSRTIELGIIRNGLARIDLRITIANDVITNVYLVIVNASGTEVAAIALSPTSAIYAGIQNVEGGYYVHGKTVAGGTAISVANGNLADALYAFGVDGTFFADIDLELTSAVSTPAISVSNSIQGGTLMEALDQIDYHVPMVINNSYIFTLDNLRVSTYDGIHLVKETYASFLANKDNVWSCVRWMMLGLLAPSSTHGRNFGRDNRRRGRAHGNSTESNKDAQGS